MELQTSPPPPPGPSPSPLKAFSSALVVIGLCASLVAGSKLRDKVDLGQTPDQHDPSAGMVASRQRDAGGVDLDSYYNAVEDLLKEDYVEPISDENKLAVGAVRGMVTSLGDPRSKYMDKGAFAAYQQVQEGHYSGIGVDFVLAPTSVDLSADDPVVSDTDPTSDVVATRIPHLIVNSVVPGGPADKAGVKPGDRVDSVDGHWVVDAELIAHYRALAVAAKTGKASSELDQLKNELRSKSESAIMPVRAEEILSQGSSGKATVTFARGATDLKPVTIMKAEVSAPGNVVEGGVIKLRFGKDAASFLASAISGKRSVTIDLRNQPEGYFDSVVGCMSAIAPAGDYGVFVTGRKGENPAPFKVKTGNANAPSVTLLVDGSVHGPAAIFALALSSHGVAKLQGSEVSRDHSRTMVEGLPDGSGYTLVTAEYQAHSAPAKKVNA